LFQERLQRNAANSVFLSFWREEKLPNVRMDAHQLSEGQL